MKIDTKTIQSELQELIPNIKVKVDTKMDIACSARETDDMIFIRFNPKRIHTPHQLEEHLNWLRASMVGVD